MEPTVSDAQALAQGMRASKVSMFSERGTTDEALKYAQQIIPPEHHANLTVAIMIYHNTLLECTARAAEEYERQRNNTRRVWY